MLAVIFYSRIIYSDSIQRQYFCLAFLLTVCLYACLICTC